MIQRAAIVIAELRPGGAERVVTHLAGTLPRLGVQPLVICLQGKGQLAGDLEARGVPVEALGSMKGYDLGAILRLGLLLRRFGPDVINVHDRSSLPYVVLANWLARRRPIVYTAHGLMFGEAIGQPRRLHRWASERLSAITAVSDEVAQRHARHLSWPHGVEVVPNGVPDIVRNDAHRQAIRAELGIGPRTFVFLAMGNARAEKGFEDLLEAAALLRAPAGRPFACLIVGGMSQSEYCNDLRQRHQRLGLDGTVRFLGFRQDVEAMYSAADAFVLSSRSEGLPMVVLESMMAGLPVIGTRVGGVPTALDQEHGLLAEPASPGSLAEAMRKLMNDDALCQALGRNGRGRAMERYGVERMTRRYLDVFEQVALTPRPGLRRRRQSNETSNPDTAGTPS